MQQTQLEQTNTNCTIREKLKAVQFRQIAVALTTTLSSRWHATLPLPNEGLEFPLKKKKP